MAKIDDYQPMSDEDILKALDVNIKSSIGYYDSELSKERKKVTDYYNASLPRPQHDGNSKYISQDVYTGVQAMTANLLETFSAGSKIIKFSPIGQEDIEMARVCSSYTEHVLFKMNDGLSVFQSVIMDGLMARVGVCKAFWEQRSEFQEEEFSGLTSDQLDLLLADEDVTLIESDTDESGLLFGTIEREIDTSQVCVMPVPPEEFIIEPQAKSLDDVDFVAHRTTKSLTQLRQMGYDEEKIANIASDDEGDSLETDPEILARFEHIGASRKNDAYGYIDQVREVMVYESYIRLDVEGTGEAVLHKVCKAGNQILEIEKVDRLPFMVFCPLPTPHSFFGSSFAEKLIPTQNAKTILTRGVLDHTVISNTPRYIVTKGAVVSPREITDARVGGIINTTRPDAITPMPQAPLNPFIFQTINMLNEDAEDKSSVSSLSTGLNKDVISKQNSAQMVEQLVTMSQQRMKIMARLFAQQFLKPLAYEIYRLVVENEQATKIFEIAGNFVPIEPRTWADKRDVTIEMHLGVSEQEKEVQKHLSMHTLMTQDPTLAPLYSLENRYNMMKAVLEAQGILNVDEYLTNPAMLPPPQPNPAQQMQMAMAEKQLEIQERQTQVAENKVILDAQKAQEKAELDAAKAEAQFALQADQQDLKEEQFAHKKNIDEGELALLRQSDDLRGIASPTG